MAMWISFCAETEHVDLSFYAVQQNCKSFKASNMLIFVRLCACLRKLIVLISWNYIICYFIVDFVFYYHRSIRRERVSFEQSFCNLLVYFVFNRKLIKGNAPSALHSLRNCHCIVVRYFIVNTACLDSACNFKWAPDEEIRNSN